MYNFASHYHKYMIPSPYRRGADDGFIFGIYLSAMFLASLLSTHFPVLSLVSLLMAAIVPVVIFLFMKRFDSALREYSTFPMLWMQGVVIFVCGILISGTVMVVYLKWIEPDYVITQLHTLVEAGATSDDANVKSFAKVAEQMLEANFIPTPIVIVTELIMLAIVTGSILSIILSTYFTVRRKAALRRFLDK